MVLKFQMNTENTLIDIFVRSKYQEILDMFLETFLPTVTNTKLWVFHNGLKIPKGVNSIKSEYLGNTAYIPVIQDILKRKGARVSCHNRNYGYFGILNDDIIFTDGWLEDTLKLLEEHACVTPGYIVTHKKENLLKAVETTKNDSGTTSMAVGFCNLMRLNLFLNIGNLDERFDWACDDLDLLYRIYLNGYSSVTSNKITIAHCMGMSRNYSKGEQNRWIAEGKRGEDLFSSKHGRINYVRLRNMLKPHNYFINYEKRYGKT